MCVSVERKKHTFRKIVNCFHYTKPIWEKKSAFATSNIGVIICTNLGKSHTICGTFLKTDQNIRLWSVYCILIVEGEYNGSKLHKWRSCSWFLPMATARHCLGLYCEFFILSSSTSFSPLLPPPPSFAIFYSYCFNPRLAQDPEVKGYCH